MRVRGAVVFISLFLVFSSLAQAQGIAASDVDYGPLGKGSVHLGFLPSTQGNVIVELSTDLQSIAGIVISAPGASRSLIVIGSSKAAAPARKFLSSFSADASIGLGIENLAGQQPQIALPAAALQGLEALKLTLVSQEGRGYPVTLQAQDWSGKSIGIAFPGTAGRCYSLTLDCTGPGQNCHVQTTC